MAITVPVDYTFYTYGDVSTLWGIVNSVVLICGSSVYQTMVRLMLTFGALLMSLYMMGLGTHHARGWKWLVTVAIMSSLLFGPKSTVAIEDATGQQAPAVIDHVPTALALFFGTKSAVGHQLTQIAETAFQTIPSSASAGGNFVLPAELSYLNHGMMFGPRVIQASRSATIADPILKADVTNYVKDCVMPAVGNLISLDALMKAPNIWAEMANTNNAMFAAYWSGSQYAYDTCPTVYGILDTRLSAATNDMTRQLAALLFPSAPDAGAANLLLQDGLVAAYSKGQIAAAAADANSIVLQNALISVLSDASGVMASQMGDSTSVLQAWAQQQGAVQTNASFIAQGQTVGAALPIVKNVIDGILIGVFPIICLLLIASEGEMLKSIGVKYVMVMVWTELWPFLFALVSYFGNSYASQHVAMMSFVPGAPTVTGGIGVPLSAINADAIYSGSISDIAVVGWAMGLVTVISGALLFGFDRLVQAAGTSHLGQSSAQNAGQAATGTASGGVVNFDKYDLAMQKTDPNMVRQETVSGAHWSDGSHPFDASLQRWDARLGSSPIKMSDAVQMGASWSEQSKMGVSQATSDVAGASNSINSALSRMTAYARERGDNQLLQHLDQLQHSDQFGLTASQEASVVDQISHDLGISLSEAQRRELRSSLVEAASVGTGDATPFLQFKLQQMVQHSGATASSEDIKSAMARATAKANSYRYGNQASAIDAALKSEAFTRGDSQGESVSKRVAGDISEAKDYVHRADSSLRTSHDYAELAEKSKLLTTSIGFDFVREINSFAWTKGINPETVTSDQARVLVTDFLHERTAIAHNDKGSFLSLNEFYETAAAVPLAHTVRSSDTYSPQDLKSEHDAANAQVDSAWRESQADQQNRQRVRAMGAHSQGTAANAASTQAGLKVDDGVQKPAELHSTASLKPADQILKDATHIKTANQGYVEAEGSRLEKRLDSRWTNRATDPIEVEGHLKDQPSAMPKPPAGH